MLRLLDLGTVPAPVSQSVYHAVAETARAGDAPTLIIVSPETGYVCVGFHQVASREVDRAYCEAEGILVGRRLVGGGAVWLDANQVFWHLILPRWTATVEALYARFLPAQVRAYRRLGIAAEHRPVNDLVVGRKKIGGTGAARIGDATVLVGSLLFDFPVQRMARVLKVSSEKFRDKMVASLEEYMTSMRRELGVVPDRARATAALVEEMALAVGERIEPGRLSDAELLRSNQYAAQLFDPAFVYQREGWIAPGVKIQEGIRLSEGVHKAPGGLVRVIYRERDGLFDDVLIGGDFFVDPADGLDRVAQALVGQSVGADSVRRAWDRWASNLSVPGVTREDLAMAFQNAAELVPL